MKNLKVAKTKNGKGIIALKKFKRDEVVFEVLGKIIKCDFSSKLDKKTSDNAYRYNEDFFLSPKGEIGDFLNHSCSPNSKVKKFKNKLFIRSIKNIKKDEEVTIDYSTIIARDDVWTMKCKCGEDNCRSKIKSIGDLPKDVFSKYVRLRIIPKYILNIK
jgi:SET domain-containing protein